MKKKEAGEPKPWSSDPIFQKTYFCNVNREDDKVTKWIREFYSPYVDDPMFEYNIIFSRFINWPETLEHVGYKKKHIAEELEDILHYLAADGRKVWGSAYVITTHGMKMDKAHYLAHYVLGAVAQRLESLRAVCRGTSLATAAAELQRIDGIGSFLSAQVVADLKNTDNHPLQEAEDWWSFVQPGPGSLRGCEWFHNTTVTPASFPEYFRQIREFVEGYELPTALCNQDLQNCLCEFDKYMRVRNRTGRSKRKYNGW